MKTNPQFILGEAIEELRPNTCHISGFGITYNPVTPPVPGSTNETCQKKGIVANKCNLKIMNADIHKFIKMDPNQYTNLIFFFAT